MRSPTREHHLSLSQFLVLDALAEHGARCRMTELAELSGRSATELSRVVVSLEERAWLLRVSDAQDSPCAARPAHRDRQAPLAILGPDDHTGVDIEAARLAAASPAPTRPFGVSPPLASELPVR